MTESSDKSSRDDDSSMDTGDSQPSWRLRGPLQDFRIVRRLSRTGEETHESVPGILLVAELDRWLSSVSSRRVCHELYEAVTGMGSSDLLLYQRSDRPEQIRRRLAKAFRDGELLALPLGPPRIRSGGGPKSAGTAPVLVPRLPDSMAVDNSAPEEQKPKETKADEKEAELSWVAFELVDEDGTPISDVRYRVVLPNGEVREGTLDSQGQAIIEDIAKGTCKIFFPDLDDSDESQGGESESDESDSGEEDDL